MGGAFAEEGTSFDSDLTDENTTTELPEESSANSPLQLAYNDPELRAAHAYVESRGNPNAVSEKGAEGMFQFIPETWKQYGPKGKSPRDPVASAAARDNYYKDLLEMYDGDTELALAAYHAGPTNVNAWIKKHGTRNWSELKEKIKDKNPRSAEYPGLVLDAYQKKKGSAPFSPEGEEPEGERSFYQLGNATSIRPSKLEIAREYTDSIEAVRSAYKNWDLGKTPGSIQDFSKMMLPIVNSGSYSDLSQVEKLNLLSKAYNNDTWDDSVASFVQDRAAEIIKGMTSTERPSIESLVYEIAGPAPQFGTGSADETKAAIRDWKSTVYKRFNEAHVRPELFGDLLPEYFKKVEESEDDAAAIRNRSALAWAFNKTGNMAVSTAKGVVEANITSPLAMLSRVAVYPFSAEASESVGNWIAALPEIMGKPSTDYLYETTPDGHFKLVNGMPILKKTDEYLRMAGSILGYLVPAKWLGAKAAEAAFVKAATGSSSSFAKLVKYGIGGDLTLSMMEGAYKKSEAAGGTVKENMLSAFATMPVSAAASFGLLNVASGAMPRLTELNAITRNRMIFSHIAKHAVDSGAVMGLQVAAQAGVIGQVLDKDVYNKEEIINAALIAGAVGGLVKATEVPGILKADARITADMQKNKLFREEQSKAEAERLFQLRNASPEERKIVEDALLKFQTSPAAALNLTKKQAALVLYNPYYKNLLANISAEVTPIPEGGVTITRKTTYVPKTEAATDLKELDKLIADLERQTGKNAIGPESLQKAIARKDQLEAKLNSEINYQDEKWKTWANQHTKLQQALNKAEADAQEAYKYRRTDRDRWREAKQAVDEAKKELSKFNKDNEVFTSRYWKSTSKLSDEFSRSVSDIVSEYKALEGKVTTAVQDDLYINNQVAMQNHLAELYKMRPAFVAQMFKELKANKAAEAEQEQILTTEAKDAELNKKLAAEEQIDADRVAELAERGELFKRLGLKRAPESASFEEGMVIEGKKVIRGSNGKWYVFNELNEQISKGYELRADAVEALENNFKEVPASEQGKSGPAPTRTGVSGEATDEGLARAKEESYALRTEQEAEDWAKDSPYSVIAFHGTPDNRFTEFSNEFLGSNTGAEGAKLGHFAVNDYRDATVYTKSFGKSKEAGSPGVLKIRLKANNPITVDLAKENHGSITAKFVNDLKAKGHDLIEFIWSYQKVNPKKYYMWFDPKQATIITESKDAYQEASFSLGPKEEGRTLHEFFKAKGLSEKSTEAVTSEKQKTETEEFTNATSSLSNKDIADRLEYTEYHFKTNEFQSPNAPSVSEVNSYSDITAQNGWYLTKVLSTDKRTGKSSYQKGDWALVHKDSVDQYGGARKFIRIRAKNPESNIDTKLAWLAAVRYAVVHPAQPMTSAEGIRASFVHKSTVDRKLSEAATQAKKTGKYVSPNTKPDLIEYLKLNERRLPGTFSEEPTYTDPDMSMSLGAEEGVYKRTIQPDPAYETLRPVDKPRYPLSSKYTQLEKFDRTGTEPVRATDVMQMLMNAAKGFEHNLKLIVGGVMPKAVKLRDGTMAKVHGYVNLMRGIWKVGRHDDVTAAYHEFIHLVSVEALQGKGVLNSLAGEGDFSGLPDKVRYAALRMGLDFTPNAERLPEVEQIKEGLAKFWEHYVSKQPVHQDLLDWYHGEFKASNPKMYKMLENVKDKMFEYYNQSPSAYIGSRIAEPKSAIRKGLQKITTDMFHRTLFNRWSILRQIDPLIEKDYETHYGRSGELASALIDGKPTDFYGTPLPGSSFRQLLDSIPGKGDIFAKYLIANRAVALGTPAEATTTKAAPGSILMSKKPKLTEEQTRHMRETGIAYEEAKAFVDQVKAEHPDVVNVADKYYTQWLDNMYRVLEQMGPQTQWMVNVWKKNNLEATRTEHGYWVPFQAEGYDFILPSAPMTGSARAKINPLISMEPAVRALFNTGLKQRVLSSIIEAATSSPAPFNAGHLVREVTGQQRQGLVRELEQRMQTLFGDAAESNITKAGTVAFLMPEFAGRSGDNFRTYVLMDGKKPRFFEMDPKVIKALDNSLWEMTTNPYWKFLMNFPAAVVRPMVTTYSTAFQLRNSARDLATAWRFIETSGLGAGDAAKLLQYYMASVADQLTFRRGKTTEGWFALFNRLGVTHSTKYLTERELMRSAGTKPIRGLEMLNRSFNWMSDKLSFTENATRAAATRMMLETKFNITDPNQPLKPFQAAEAIWFYKNVTTNFQKQGSVTRNINQWVPFFTARIAEFSRLPGDFKRNPGKMLALAGTSLAYGYMHAIAHKDTPWYQEMEAKQKMQSITFEYTDSQGVNRVGFIPLDSWNALSWGIGQAIGNLAIQDPNLKPSLIELAKAYFLGVTPINHPVDFLGVVGKEIAQQAMNKDYYFNRTIVPPGMEFVPTQYQSHELTTQLAKFLGETFGWSPIRIDHAIRTVTPTVSKIAMFGDKELGYQKAAETRSTNFIYNALSRTGGVSAVLDRSKEMFNDALLKFRSNKGIETVEEEQIRKAIEKVNKNISFASTALYMRLEQSERDTIRKYIKTMLTLGINISKGKVPPIVPSSQFRQEAQRIQQQKTAQRKARRAAFEEED